MEMSRWSRFAGALAAAGLLWATPLAVAGQGGVVLRERFPGSSTISGTSVRTPSATWLISGGDPGEFGVARRGGLVLGALGSGLAESASTHVQIGGAWEASALMEVRQAHDGTSALSITTGAGQVVAVTVGASRARLILDGTVVAQRVVESARVYRLRSTVGGGSVCAQVNGQRVGCVSGVSSRGRGDVTVTQTSDQGNSLVLVRSVRVTSP